MQPIQHHPLFLLSLNLPAHAAPPPPPAPTPQFVAEFFSYEPLPQQHMPPTHLASPWSLLQWQAGDAFDLATLAASLLLGAGYNAHVLVGHCPKQASQRQHPGGLQLTGCGAHAAAAAAAAAALRCVFQSSHFHSELNALPHTHHHHPLLPPPQVALNDQSRCECPWLEQHCMEAPPYVDVPPASSEQQQPQGGSSVQPEGELAVEQHLSESYTPGSASATEPLTVPGTSAEAIADKQPEAEAGSAQLLAFSADGVSAASTETTAVAAEICAGAAVVDQLHPPAAAEEQAVAAEAVDAVKAPSRYLHAFVLVLPGRRGVTAPLLLDPASGRMHTLEAAPCSAVECCWNATNFCINLQMQQLHSGGDDGGSSKLASMDWNFQNPNHWLPLLQPAKEVSTTAALHQTSCVVTLALTSRSAALQDCLLDCGGTVASELSLHSKASEGLLLLRSRASRASMLLSTRQPSLSLGAAAAATSGRSGCFTPRGGNPATLAGTGTAACASTVSGSPLPQPMGDPSLAHQSPAECVPQRCSPTRAPPSAEGGRASSCMPAAAAASSECSAAQLPPQAVEMPLSWVPALGIARERLDMRCPRGATSVRYRQARRDLFASIGECSGWDGKVRWAWVRRSLACRP